MVIPLILPYSYTSDNYHCNPLSIFDLFHDLYNLIFHSNSRQNFSNALILNFKMNKNASN